MGIWFGDKFISLVVRANTIGVTPERFPVFTCPTCGTQQTVNSDQFMGRATIRCAGCGWFQTKDWSRE